MSKEKKACQNYQLPEVNRAKIKKNISEKYQSVQSTPTSLKKHANRSQIYK